MTQYDPIRKPGVLLGYSRLNGLTSYVSISCSLADVVRPGFFDTSISCWILCESPETNFEVIHLNLYF